MHITDRLKSARHLQSNDDTEDLAMFDAWKVDIKVKATAAARLAVKQELDTHESTVAKYHAETEASYAKRDAAIALQVAAEEKTTAMGKSLKIVKDNWSTTKSALAKGAEEYKSQLIVEQLKLEELNLYAAHVEGQLSEAVKAPKVVPQPIIKPTPVPDFVFTKTNVGMDGLATEWTATPKRLN